MKDDIDDKAGIMNYNDENVKNFMYGAIAVEFCGAIINVMSLTEGLLNSIGILISYPTEGLCISYTVTVYFLPAIIFTMKGAGSLNVDIPIVSSLVILISTGLLTALFETIALICLLMTRYSLK